MTPSPALPPADGPPPTDALARLDWLFTHGHLLLERGPIFDASPRLPAHPGLGDRVAGMLLTQHSTLSACFRSGTLVQHLRDEVRITGRQRKRTEIRGSEPAQFVMLKRLGLSPNGHFDKLDEKRRARIDALVQRGPYSKHFNAELLA